MTLEEFAHCTQAAVTNQVNEIDSEEDIEPVLTIRDARGNVSIVGLGEALNIEYKDKTVSRDIPDLIKKQRGELAAVSFASWNIKRCPDGLIVPRHEAVTIIAVDKTAQLFGYARVLRFPNIAPMVDKFDWTSEGPQDPLQITMQEALK